MTLPAANLFTSPSGKKIDKEYPCNQAQKSDMKVLKPDCSEKHFPGGSSERKELRNPQMFEQEYNLRIICRKRDHLLNYLLRLNFELVVR